jgi:hypothetical protein
MFSQVLQQIGLCICMYELLWCSEGVVGQGTGIVNVNGTALNVPTISLISLMLSSSGIHSNYLPSIQG